MATALEGGPFCVLLEDRRKLVTLTAFPVEVLCILQDRPVSGNTSSHLMLWLGVIALLSLR